MDTATSAFDFEQLATPREEERPLRLDEAARHAAALVQQAQREADQLRDHARAAGFSDGVSEGRAEAMRQLEPAAAALVQALAAVREQEGRIAEHVECEAVTLAVQIAAKVVAGAIEAEPERVLDVIRGALRAVVERERVVVQVNPLDLDLVRASIAEVAASLGGIEQIEVQEERRVARGGAILRTPVGEVDARLDTKLERAREAVMAELVQ